MDTTTATSPSPGPDAGTTTSGPARRLTVVLVAVLGVLLAVFAVVAYVLTGGFGSTAPGAELEGRWSGTGTVATCDGVVCPPGEEAELVVDCSRTSCTVEVLDERAEIQEAGDGFTASGSIPPWHLGSCTGGGFVTGQWSLDLTLDGDVLEGHYTEQTTSSCGPVVSRTTTTTEAALDLELTRAGD